MQGTSLGWLSIIRLGLVQSAIGAIVVLATSVLNRVMVVELALAASIPAGLVAWHYAVQLSRPHWGHKSDNGRRRSHWIVYGVGILALGVILAANAIVLIPTFPMLGSVLSFLAFAMIGAGVAAGGTCLLAFLASSVAQERRPAAAAVTWVMMIVGIVLTAGVAGGLLDPYSAQRLVLVTSGVAMTAFVVTLLALYGVEAGVAQASDASTRPRAAFSESLREIWKEKIGREFTIFVFISMFAYSAQELILEPFAGLVFGFTLGESTQLAGIQHAGVLAGMVLLGVLGTFVKGDRAIWMKGSIVFGCLASAAALVALAASAFQGASWSLRPIVFSLGLANGIFAVSAIGLMMTFAGAGRKSREGVRMGVWGAAQAIAFALGGFMGAAGLDVMRQILSETAASFATVFGIEAALFVAAALFAIRLGAPERHKHIRLQEGASPVESFQ